MRTRTLTWTAAFAAPLVAAGIAVTAAALRFSGSSSTDAPLEQLLVTGASPALCLLGLSVALAVSRIGQSPSPQWAP